MTGRLHDPLSFSETLCSLVSLLLLVLKTVVVEVFVDKGD